MHPNGTLYAVCFHPIYIQMSQSNCYRILKIRLSQFFLREWNLSCCWRRRRRRRRCMIIEFLFLYKIIESPKGGPFVGTRKWRMRKILFFKIRWTNNLENKNSLIRQMYRTVYIKRYLILLHHSVDYFLLTNKCI